MPARRVPGRTTAGLDSCVRPEGGPRCLRQYPIEQALRQYPIEQDVRGRDAHVGVQHTCATAHSCCGLEGGEDSNLSIQRSQNAGGAAWIQLRASARGAVKVLIPLIMATPWLTCVSVRTGAGHADVRLGGLWNRHCLEKDTRARVGLLNIKTDNKFTGQIYFTVQ